MTDTRCVRNNIILNVVRYASGFCLGDRYKVVGGITESSYANNTIRVACDENHFNVCNKEVLYSFRWPYQNPFYLSDKYKSGTVLICNREPPYSIDLKQIKCLDCRSRNDLCYFLLSGLSLEYHDESCESRYGVVIPKNNSSNITHEKNLRELLCTGFEMKWNISDACTSCEASGGICYTPDYYNGEDYLEACICANGPHQFNCSDGNLLYQRNGGCSRNIKQL
ncbi:hypothetical protein SUGI_0552950 [Cryptomeria japonica]|nr:hypothetical protein SUGI_0552950 [Cryptomeria japonica]